MRSTGLRGMWWWVDRWRKSSAYMDMTLEQQGAYRNLLDEANLRGGALPNDERILARACGDVTAWDRVKDIVMARFELEADGWHHTTLDEVLSKSIAFSRKQSLNGQRGNAVRWGNRQMVANGVANGVAKTSPPDPDPDPDPDQDQDPDPVRLTDAAISSPSAPKNGARVSADTLSRFLRFWDAYPAKKGKAKAQKAWTRLRPSEALTDTIVAAVIEQRSWPEWLKEHGRYVPNPATWLNQGRWDDEPSRTGGQASLLSDIGIQNRLNAAIAVKRIMEES